MATTLRPCEGCGHMTRSDKRICYTCRVPSGRSVDERRILKGLRMSRDWLRRPIVGEIDGVIMDTGVGGATAGG